MEQELNRRDVVKRSDGYTAKDSKLCDSIIMDGDTQVKDGVKLCIDKRIRGAIPT